MRLYFLQARIAGENCQETFTAAGRIPKSSASSCAKRGLPMASEPWSQLCRYEETRAMSGKLANAYGSSLDPSVGQIDSTENGCAGAGDGSVGGLPQPTVMPTETAWPAQRRAVSLTVPAPITYGTPPGGTMRRRTDISGSRTQQYPGIAKPSAMGLLLS